MGKLDGKTAIVTGASRGIGQAIAELFAAEGAQVACAARTLNEGDHNLEGSLARTVATIRETGGRAQAFVAKFATNHWMRAFAVNVHGPFMLAKAVLPHMTDSGRGGAIVNIGSGAAIGPGSGPYDPPAARGGTMYGATKAALERFTQGLAEEVASRGNIAVSCVSPSKVVPTPGTVYHHLVDSMDDPRGEAPEYMARASLLLASEAAEKVNGRVTYSQLILGEFGWMENPVGRGIDSKGSGYSEV